MEKRNSSGQLSENQKKYKTTEHKKVKDPCIVCDEELNLDGQFTQRIGLLNEMDEVVGWVCPHCRSEFDTEGKITNLGGNNNISGEA
jgi:uncharacterized protein with PIN domain